MKTVIFLTAFLGTLTLYVTKPDDYTCIQAAESNTGLLGAAGATVGITKYLYTVEDHILYKNVVSRLTGRVVARAYLGSVHFL